MPWAGLGLALAGSATARGGAGRHALRMQEMRFSLVVSVLGPGVYAAIKPRVEATAAVSIET